MDHSEFAKQFDGINDKLKTIRDREDMAAEARFVLQQARISSLKKMALKVMQSEKIIEQLEAAIELSMTGGPKTLEIPVSPVWEMTFGKEHWHYQAREYCVSCIGNQANVTAHSFNNAFHFSW
jgi:hypothetical protein